MIGARSHTRSRTTLGLGLALVLACGALAVGATPAQAAPLPYPAPVESGGAAGMTSDVLPTAQIDSGVVWALKVVGNTVYAGGSFSAARPAGATAGTNTVPRGNILAFNLTTGALTSFAPSINGQVKALATSTDGTKLYVGGTFTAVNGQTRYNFAAFDTATGNLLSFAPAIGGAYVNALAGSKQLVNGQLKEVLYVGGLISAGNGVARKNLMAFDVDTSTNARGTLLGWAPTADLQVDTMVMAPAGDKVIVGGRFYSINGVVQRGMAALSPTDGSILPWAVAGVVKNGWNDGSSTSGKAGIYSLSTDGNAVFGTGWVYSSTTVGNLEGSFSANPSNGAINWLEDCHGDTYTAYSDTNYVYETGHPHDCESVGGYPQKDTAPTNMHSSKAWSAATKGTLWRTPRISSIYVSWEGQPSPAMLHWFPDWTTGSATGQGQAGWVMSGSGDYLVVGGEFPYVNGKTQQGLVRFARGAVSGAKDGPRLSGTGWVPSVTSVDAGTARITIPGNWDRDGINLTYRITRSGVAQPVYTTTKTSYFWYQPTVTFMDTGLTPGSSYTYQVTATDEDGNVAKSATATVTATSATVPAYVSRVVADGASPYWRLGGTDGTTDVIGLNNGVKGTGVTNATTGAIGSGTGYSFNGNSTSGSIGGSIKPISPDGWSAEVWFKTTSLTGGKLFGYGSSQSGFSATYDRHLYMSNDGRLNFGIFQNNSRKVITSSGTYRNGAWHHAVVTSSPAGTALFVDGAQVASDTTAIKAQAYFGNWRVGGDTLNNWPNRGTNDFFIGDLDEFAAYSYPLTGAQVQNHYQLGTGATAPAASFTSTVNNLNVAVNGSGSTAQPGSTITSYSWDFGDGTAGANGATASHDYVTGGTYNVTLTVTDSRGLVGTTTKSVTVAPPHQAPTASFTASMSGLTASVDASASSASDGATLSYNWNWGDGTANGTGKTATHAYATTGSKTITLTLTDSLGATSTTTRTVTAGHANPSASFTASTDGFTTSVNASASTASDGATLTYDWNWGDGTSHDSGVSATHTYASAGDYTVTLTVTDSFGSTDAATRTVTAADPASLVVVDAPFSTDVSTGWGSANKGGSWTTSGTGFSVSGGIGRLSLAASGTRSASLNAVAEQNVVGALRVGLDKVPAASDPAVSTRAEVNYDLRKGTDGSYRVKVRFMSNNTVSVYLTKMVGTTETALATKTITGYTYAAGDMVDVSFEVTGDGTTTTARAKVWGPGQSEPSTWTVSGTDTTATLQDAGSVGLVGYVPSSVANGPIQVRVDDVTVTKV